MRILFMGTPEFAVPSLDALCRAGHELCGVFTQPDKPKNRGMKLQAPPVKEYALSRNIPVFQPETLKDGAGASLVSSLAPELIAVAAYGRILPREILDYPRLGCVNVHSSLLPKYRGAAPIHWAVLNGESETGVTIMHMAPELDAGDLILQAVVPIGEEDTAAQVHDRLALLGGDLLVEAVKALEAGTAPRTPQEHETATYAPMLSRALSPMDFSHPARQLHNQVRGLSPWPAAVTDCLGGEPVKVFRARITQGRTGAPPGTILAAGAEGIDVACGDGAALRLLEIQAAGSRRMSAGDYLRGHPVKLG